MDLQLHNFAILHSRFPGVCARTGEDCEESAKLVLRRPGWRVYFSMLIPVPFLFLYLTWIGSARCTFRFAITGEEAKSLRLRQFLLIALLVLGHVNMMLAGFVLPFHLGVSSFEQIFFMQLMCLALIVGLCETARRTHVWIKKINQDTVTLAGLHPRFVEEYLCELDECDHPPPPGRRDVADGESTGTDATVGRE